MVKKSLVWLYSVTTYLLWAVVITLAAVVLSLRYYVLPHAKDYREPIARHASEVSGLRITIGDIAAGWDGMRPYFDLYKVNVYDPQGKAALQLDHVETGLSWLTLVLGEPRLAELVIHQPNVLIRRAQNGEVFVAGISLNAPSRPDFPNWLLRQSSIRVDDATVVWQDDMRQAPPLSLNKLRLQVSNPPWGSFLGQHNFGILATPSAGSSTPLDIRGNVWGKDVSQPDQWNGTIYAKLEGTDVAAWHTWIDIPFDLSQGFGAAQFWMNFAQGHVNQMTADVVLANARTRFTKEMPETGLQTLSGRLTWQRTADGQIMQAKKLRLATEQGFRLDQGEVKVKVTGASGKETLEGEASLDELGLDSFSVFAANLPLGQDILNHLVELAPKGKLHSTTFSWRGDRTTAREYKLSSQFTALGISPTRGIPGFSGLSGKIEATEKGGRLDIDSQNALLDLKDILRWPIPADKLSGRVDWTLQNNSTEVKIIQLAITNQHLTGSLNASYRYDGTKGGYLDLNGNFGNANGKFAKFYYPLVLDKETLDWLDTSILDAHGEKVNVVIKGYLDDFPYTDNKNGEFKVSARITDGLLDYADGWPRINGIGLDMLFHGDSMDLNVDRGMIYGGKISKAKVSIPVLDAEHPVLQIQGEMQAQAPDVLKFIAGSPVIGYIDHFTDSMTATGNGKVVLDITLPLDDPDRTKVKGSYTLLNGTLTSNSSFPPLDAINGKLSFTESSLSARNISANIYGGPGNLHMETGSNGLLRITANGRIGENGIRQAFNHPLLQKVHGATDWDAEINLRNHLSDIAIKSQLTGLSISLPPPFSKGTMDSQPLRIGLQQKTSTQDLLSITLGNVANAKLLRNEKPNHEISIERGTINFGEVAELPAQTGIVINGKLAHLDWDLWSDLLNGSENPTNSSMDAQISAVNLDIGMLDVAGRRINNMNLKAKPETDGWRASLQSREISGDARWQSAGKGKILARLKTLTVPGPAPAKMTETIESEKPQEYPDLDIVAENFEAKDKKLGRLEMLASQQGRNWDIDKLLISNPDSSLLLQGAWNNWKYRQPTTNLQINWDIENIGKTLERFGYPDTVKAGSATLSGQINWQGSPHEFNLPGLGGNLQLEAKNGQFLKIQPGVGRLLGVLSLQALPRRLLFDFRDVFNDGFAFDRIGGNLLIDRGLLSSKDFRMEGPAAKVAISGKTNLDRETLDLKVKVSPSLSDTVSLAALAGGPVAGAAAFVAQKLLRDPLNKLASYEYEITGTWDDPQERKSVAEKKESPVQNPLGK